MQPLPPKVPTPTAEFEPDLAGKLSRPSTTFAAPVLDQQSDCPVQQGVSALSFTASTENDSHEPTRVLRILANIDLSISGIAPAPTSEKRTSLVGSVISVTQRPASQTEALLSLAPLDRPRSGREPQAIDEKDFGCDGASVRVLVLTRTSYLSHSPMKGRWRCLSGGEPTNPSSFNRSHSRARITREGGYSSNNRRGQPGLRSWGPFRSPRPKGPSQRLRAAIRFGFEASSS